MRLKLKLQVNDLQAFKDEFYIPVVGPWAIDKYRILMHYNDMFSTGMKNRWNNRIYIDLFSAAGFAKVRGSNNDIVLTSSLIAQNLKTKYNKYIYCDKDPNCIEALNGRIKKYFPESKCEFIIGDCNEKIDDIVGKVPTPSAKNTVLTFCVVDPFNLKINFETLKKLTKFRVDILVLLSWMDGNRNEYNYIKPSNERIDKFLGSEEWRVEWGNSKLEGEKFCKFLADKFVLKMIGLGYLEDAKKSMKEIRSTQKNISLYHLAFFSKDQKGYYYWNKARYNAPMQSSLPFED